MTSEKDVLPMSEEQIENLKKDKLEEDEEVIVEKAKKGKDAPTKTKLIKKPFVMQNSRNSSITHFGADGQPYVLNRGIWNAINEEDVEYFEKKTKKNATWHVEWREVPERRLAHLIRFNGTDENKYVEVPMSSFDHETDDPEVNSKEIYLLKAGEWVEVQPEDGDRMSIKALNSKHYDYKEEYVEVS